jgi:hypothetical protein
VSTSRLKYIPTIEDDGRYLSCRVIIRAKTEKVLEDSWEIKVLCKYLTRKNNSRERDRERIKRVEDCAFYGGVQRKI